MQGILFATPCYGGLVTAQHFRSCLSLKADLTLSNIPHDWVVAWNESLVTRARNEMTATFLKTDWSHMMWIDADIEFATDDVIKLWNLDADVAAGFYCMKRPDKPLSAWKDGKLVQVTDEMKEPFAVDYAGTGFFMIRRDVIEKLAETAETYEGPVGPVKALYMTPVTDGCFESEDYYFCRKAREAGFKIMGDPTIKLKHWGQFAYGA